MFVSQKPPQKIGLLEALAQFTIHGVFVSFLWPGNDWGGSRHMGKCYGKNNLKVVVVVEVDWVDHQSHRVISSY